ncbi:MAG TPA: Gfo/Idh/MocA family oxidoreductase [Rubrobacteraceae bacterium]|nr:Gfo/Idh/MocA family oxidoreductase [Rubrobacteraceae bacterium]
MSLRSKLEALERAGTPIRVGLVGAGQMGRGFIAQVAGIPGMETVAAADMDPQRGLDVFREVGLDPVEGLNGHPGRPAVTHDAAELARSEAVDVVVEATGVTEVGARVAYEAIQERKHVVMLNAETDATIGAILARMARSAGVVYTGSAGDEPAAIMELYDFARSMGFEVVLAGKGKNNPLDVEATPESVAEEAGRKNMNPKMLAAFVDGTKTMVEMATVANAIGFVPDVPGMHGPAETDPRRLGEIFSLEKEGGILSSYGTVDYVRGVAPGVFVVVRSHEGPVQETLEYLGMGGGPNHVFYRPYHLTSLETPLSVARAVVFGEEAIISRTRPTAEVVAVAKRDLDAGEKLGGIGGADYYGTVYPVSDAREMLPLGLAAGARTTRPVPKGSVIPRAGVELPENSFVVNLRRLQDAALEN